MFGLPGDKTLSDFAFEFVLSSMRVGGLNKICLNLKTFYTEVYC